MKYLKMLGLAAAAIGVLMAFVGTSTSSALVWCTVNKNPCPKADTVLIIVETPVKGTSALLQDTSGSTLNTCTGGELEAGEATQGAGKPISAPIKALTWSGCSNTIHTLKKGSLEVTSLSGTVTGKETEFTTMFSGVSCTYGTGTGTHLGTQATSGEETTMTFEAVLSKTAGGFLCPSDIRWQEKWHITNHKVVYVVSEGE